jgi:hypothetical protein
MFESFSFSSNKVIEGYDFKPNAKEGTIDFSNNILALQEKSNNLDANDIMIDQNYRKTDTRLNELRVHHQLLYSENKYKNIYIPDKTDLVKTTKDVREQDTNIIMTQQNYVYIVGSITCATLLVAAIVIGRQ